MVGEIVTGLGLFKSMLDTAKGLKDINDASVRNTVAIELQEKILTAQETQALLVERVRDLEQQVIRFETWETEKQRYELTELPPGVFAYSLKEDTRSAEPFHRICATCYESGKKSILQSKGQANGLETLHCNSCDSNIRTGYFQPPRVTR